MADETSNEVVYKYKYSATAQIIFDKEDVEDIAAESIGEFIIDYSYDEYTMPMIYMNITLKDSIIYKLSEKQNIATIVLTVQKYVYEEDKAPLVMQDYIKRECIYFLMDDYTKSNVSEELDEEGTNLSSIVIGLMDKELVNNTKKDFNGTITGDMMSIVYTIINSGRDILIEPLQYNTQIKNMLVPSLNSKKKLLNYLNDMSCFYDTKFRYFNDFDVTYFMSSDGNNVQRKNDKFDTIYINITPYQVNSSVYEGMVIDAENFNYTLNISEQYASPLFNNITDRTYTNIRGIDADGEAGSEKLDTTDENMTIEKYRNIKINNGNTTLLKNIKSTIDMSKNPITISKTDIDSSIFTINRKYFIDASDVYGVEMNGQYLLGTKTEIFIREGKDFVADVTMTFFKLNK